MPLNRLSMQVFGGVNYNDEPGSLFQRSHASERGTWMHRIGATGRPAPVEAADGKNFDFERQNLIKRKGSTSAGDASGVFVASDEVVASKRVKMPATGSYVTIIVGKKSIYTNQSGSFAQINNSLSSAYTHNADVNTATIIEGDGGVFIGLPGNNKIQRYRSGADLDPEMDNGNNYTDAGGTSNTITGTWGAGYDRIAFFLGRLVINNGDSNVEYTDTNQPWDLAGGGVFPARAAVNGLTVFVPRFEDSMTGFLYIGTETAWEVTSDLSSGVTIEGSLGLLGPRAFTTAPNWIVFLTPRGELWALNATRVINLGRRYLALDGASGPLDVFNTSAAAYVSHVVYDESRKQVLFWIPTNSSSDVQETLMIDFQLGEPLLNESLESFETHVRLSRFDGQDYVSAHSGANGIVGVRSAGTLWDLNNGADDYGSTAIDAEWYSPVFDAGAFANQKNWLVNFARALTEGDHNVQIDYLLDRDTGSSASYQFNQGSSGFTLGTSMLGTGTLGGAGLVRAADDTDLVSEAIQFKLSNGGAGEAFTIVAMEQRYQMLAEER